MGAKTVFFGDQPTDVHHDELELLTVEEVASLLKVPKSWISERTRRRGIDKLPHIKLGKYLQFEEKSVRAFLERRRKSPL